MSRKKVIFILLSIFFLLVLAMPGYCGEKPSCAVLLFHPDMSASNNFESQMMSNKYAELINRLDMFDVIDFNKVSEILNKKNAVDLEKTCTDLGCALKIGNKLNADFVIYGIIGNVGSLFSLDTTLVNVAGGNETQHAVYDFEGTKTEFNRNAPAENIKSLFGINEIPAPLVPSTPETAIVTATTEPQTFTSVEETPQPAEQPKNLRFGPRVGIGASNDGLEIGGGFEVRFKKLSFQFLLNSEGFATGLSFYLHQTGNSPFLSLVGSTYDTENHGVDEEGDIYGLLLGYRISLDNYVKKDFAKHIDIRVGAGVGYADWKQTEPKRGGEPPESDEEFIPICELTLGYMF